MTSAICYCIMYYIVLNTTKTIDFTSTLIFIFAGFPNIVPNMPGGQSIHPNGKYYLSNNNYLFLYFLLAELNLG